MKGWSVDSGLLLDLTASLWLCERWFPEWSRGVEMVLK